MGECLVLTSPKSEAGSQKLTEREALFQIGRSEKPKPLTFPGCDQYLCAKI
jgi:hypothetical protein